MNLNLFFVKLTVAFHLGNLLSDVVRVHGGFMHTMYRLDTVSGTYAIKLLNPNVMKRPDAMDNYNEADRLETIIQECNIPIVAALIFDGKKMQEIDGQYFYIYEWFDGKTLMDSEITTFHCQKIGAVLSRIHNIEMESKPYQCKPINIDWGYYIALAKEQGSVIFDLLYANKDLLCECQNRGNSAIRTIPSVTSICHNDMDCKNVLWLNEDFKIIDLECLDYANPYLELYELALCWSGYEKCNINFKLFRVFIEAYFKDKPKPKPNIDWESMYYSNYRRLVWLEYNVKRALLIECGTAEEQELGIGQVKETIDHVIYYSNAKAEIIRCLLDLFT